MNRSPELPRLEGFLSGGFSKVPEEITRSVGEVLDLCCALFVTDIDGTTLRPTSSWTETPKAAPEGEPMEISLLDGEHTATRLVFERQTVCVEREEWVGQKPLAQSYLAAAPVRAADQTMGILVVGSPEPLAEEVTSTLWSLGFQAGAALYLAAEYSDVLVTARRRRSLSLAAEMQQDLLPPGEMHDPRVGVAGGIEPAYEIGGDFYDYALRDGKLYAVLGDPSGKHLPAEILAAVCFTATRNARRDGEGLPGIMTAAHRAMREVSSPDQYCTMLLVEIDLATHEAEVLVAGHPPPLHISAKDSGNQASGSDGSGAHKATPLPVSRVYPPIGALDREEDYQTEHHQLGPGSKLLLFSDGVTERGDGVDGMMGVEGLVRYAAENRGLGGLSFVRGLLGTVRSHAEKPMSDDATAVILDFNGS